MHLSVSPSDAANVTPSCAYIMLTHPPKFSMEYSLLTHTSANFRRLKKTVVRCFLKLSVCVATWDFKRNGRWGLTRALPLCLYNIIHFTEWWNKGNNFVATVFSAQSQHRNLLIRKDQELQSEYLINKVTGWQRGGHRRARYK
jgi:hypothetical protein